MDPFTVIYGARVGGAMRALEDTRKTTMDFYTHALLSQAIDLVRDDTDAAITAFRAALDAEQHGLEVSWALRDALRILEG